ncbi:MAG: hypothetical protein NT178_09885 [Proteobacteria bacterium]|nr:hypothetical protein [Pseudomonadota bacterium]
METIETVFSPLKDDHSNDRERANAGTITCPYCSRNVTLVSYGDGWVGTCCDRVVFNNNQLPPDH